MRVWLLFFAFNCFAETPASQPATVYSRIHSEKSNCPSDSTIYRTNDEFADKLNSDIADEATLGLELTGVRVESQTRCDYIYTRKTPLGKTANTEFSKEQQNFDTKFLPCDDDSQVAPELLNTMINDGLKAETDKHFHLLSIFNSSVSYECIYLFVRDLNIR